MQRRDLGEHRRALVLVGLADEALVGAAGLQQVGPGLDLARSYGHGSCQSTPPSWPRCARSTSTSTTPCSVRELRCCTTARGRRRRSAPRAIEACHRADVEVVVMSGRRRGAGRRGRAAARRRARTSSRRARAVVDGPDERVADRAEFARRGPRHDLRPGRGDRRAGAAARALRRPPRVPRPVAPATARSPTCSAARSTRSTPTRCSPSTATTSCACSTTARSTAPGAWHALPPRPAAGCRRAQAVARHMRVRGYAREECIAVGDSREDLTRRRRTSGRSGSSPTRSSATRRSSTALPRNVRVAEAGHGPGVYEAVVTELAERALTPRAPALEPARQKPRAGGAARQRAGDAGPSCGRARPSRRAAARRR